MDTPARGLQLAAAVASALVIAAGVLLFDWPAFTVLAFYWLENVVIGGFTALRILVLGARGEHYLAALASTVFFTIHYGLFCLVHGVFLATLFGGIRSFHHAADPVLLMIGRVAGDGYGALVVAAIVVAAALDAWRALANADSDDPKAIGRVMQEPYGRLMVLHVVLIFGGVVMTMLNLPAAAALMLVAFKLVHDLRLLRRAPAAPLRARTVGRRAG